MTLDEWRLIQKNGIDPQKIIRIAERTFSFFSASGLTARETEMIIRELKRIYEEKTDANQDLPLMDTHKDYATRRNDASIDQESSENIFNYIVLQKMEEMQQNIAETKKMVETQQRQFSDKHYRMVNVPPWMYGKFAPLAISITALVISVVMTVIGIVY